MNILHTETLKKWGGQQNRVFSEALGLARRGHNVVIACNNNSILAKRSQKAGIKVYELNMTKLSHLRNIPKLIKIIINEKIDIVSTHSSVDSWAGGIAARLTGKKLIRFRHNLYPVGNDPLTSLIYTLPVKIIAISNAVRNVLLQRGLKEEKISVIPSSVDTDIFDTETDDLRDELNIPSDAVVIGNTSTFTYVKGQEFLLRAFNIICRRKPCFLLFAGRLPESKRNKYLDHVHNAFRSRVILAGHRDDIPRVLKTLDIFIYPSLLEGLGTALIEAMAMGRPVAVSDIPTFRDFINDRINGLYFRVKDPEDMAEKILYLMEDKNLREQLGKNAREAIMKEFTIDKMSDRTESLYSEILNV